MKASFQGNTSNNLQIAHDAGILKAYATNNMVFTPQEQEMFSQNENVQPRISIFERLGKINEPKPSDIQVGKLKKWKIKKKKKEQPRSFTWVHKQNVVYQVGHAK